jgi:3-hydroxymyristoyl/3-hydroxydecanoyl-(acyl carrier protein) dehydratase
VSRGRRLEALPHAYPFRFADRTLERTGPAAGRVRALVSAGGRGTSGGMLERALVGELMAQAALLLEGGDPQIGRSGFLAGFSDLIVEREARAGDALTVDVAMSGRMGPVARFDATVRDDTGSLVARGSFTVRKGTPEALA